MLLTDLAFPLAWRDRAAAVASALLDHDNYLVCAHVRLDGDALSSLVAMGHFLERADRRFALFAPFGVPENCGFLPVPWPVYRTLGDLPFRPSHVVALDCGEPGRLGEELSVILPELGCINIDHHPGQGMGTHATMVVPEASSTTQLLASVFFAAGVQFDEVMATPLTLGLVTDTGGFRHANTSPEVLALAAWLERQGASVHRLREHLEKIWSLARLRLWGHMSADVQLLCHGSLALCTLSLDRLEACGASGEDTEGFVEHMRDIRQVRVACFVREQHLDVCKFSLRSVEDVDVNAVAVSLGGGGHRNAAGGTLTMSLDKAASLLERRLSQLLRD